MAKKLSKEEKKELAAKAEEEALKHPKKKDGFSGFKTIDKEAEKLESEN